MRHAVAVAIALVVAGCPSPKASQTTPVTATPADVVSAAKGAVEQWRQAYEVRSFDALAKLYVHSDEIVVVQDGLAVVGWTALEPMLKDRLGKAKEIHVRLKEEHVASLGPNAAVAVATMTREVSDGITTVTENGALTLALRRGADGWQIVQEHYSYKRPG
jgi:ketosteroid isomerase-like protein